MWFACLRAACSPKKYAEGLPLAGNGVILSPLKEKVKRKPVPHFMRDFLCFGGGDRAEEVPCGSRVGGKPTYAEGLPLAGNGVILSFKFKQGLMPSVQGVFGIDRDS